MDKSVDGRKFTHSRFYFFPPPAAKSQFLSIHNIIPEECLSGTESRMIGIGIRFIPRLLRILILLNLAKAVAALFAATAEPNAFLLNFDRPQANLRHLYFNDASLRNFIFSTFAICFFIPFEVPDLPKLLF
jgi:hypothetical protein